MYGRTYGLGFLAPKINGKGSTFTTSSGFAKQPITAYAPPTPKITPTITPIKSTGLTLDPSMLRFSPDFQIPEEMRHRYSDDQIREMLARGKSETVERSGESDSGMPIDSDLEQRATENNANAAFTATAGGGPGYVTIGGKKVNVVPYILAAVAAYYLM
jgi:hypothetical protein